MANLLPHNPDGTLASLPPEALDALKTRVLDGLALGKSLLTTVKDAGGSWGTVWRLREADPAFGQAIEDWRKGVGLKSVALMEDTLEHPDQYAEGLKSAGWPNFAMITAKTAFPDMRDTTKVEVNVGTQVNVGEVDAAIDAVWRRAREDGA